MGSAHWMVGFGINLDQGQLHNVTKQLHKLLKLGWQFICHRFCLGREKLFKMVKLFQGKLRENVPKDVTYVGNHTPTHLTADQQFRGWVLHYTYMHDARRFSSWICFEALDRPTECFL